MIIKLNTSKFVVHKKIYVNQRHLQILLSNHPWFDNDTGIVTLKNKKDNFISNRMRGERGREIERGETGEGEKMVLIKNNDSYNIVECNCVFEIFGRRDN